MLKDCTRFEDAIAAGNYVADPRNPSGAGTSHYYFKDGEFYTIPYRSLHPMGGDNLLVAAKADVTVGEADIKEIQRILRKQGAFSG